MPVYFILIFHTYFNHTQPLSLPNTPAPSRPAPPRPTSPPPPRPPQAEIEEDDEFEQPRARTPPGMVGIHLGDGLQSVYYDAESDVHF
jgi:hypothetical protein